MEKCNYAQRLARMERGCSTQWRLGDKEHYSAYCEPTDQKAPLEEKISHE